MKTEYTMEIERKVYTAPELVEYGSLSEVTQNNCGSVYFDSYIGEPNYGDSSHNICI